MKRTLRVYKKTVSIVNETAIGMYQNLVGDKVGFLLESYDKRKFAGSVKRILQRI